MRTLTAFSVVGLAALMTGCGGGSSSSSTTSPTTYSVGGTISGLSGTVVLQNNGGDNLPASTNGPFAFSTTLAPASSYDVTVLTQPTDQNCTVSNASGTLSDSVNNVMVVCTNLSSAGTGDWVWRSGSDFVNAPGVYGTQGTAAAGNTPGARRQPVSWNDANGNFWLFGGDGTDDTTGDLGLLADLWEFSPSSGTWTWQGGADTQNARATYGSQGVAAPGNTPGAREGAAHWTDSAGNLWLFGGDSTSGQSATDFNDLWEYSVSSAQWIWVGGSNSAGGAGSYGSQGVAASGNLPPARTGALSWVDGSGVFWLFGGAQLNANGSSAAVLNDLWSYNPTTKLWTWLSGSSTPNAAGVYGSEGTAAAGNIPGAREGGAAWVDTSGNFWLFGGQGLSQQGFSQRYNDLWEYNPSSGEWTWAAGASTPNAAGVYGTRGTSAAGNAPGARSGSVAWQDLQGNFWLFGGNGYDQLGSQGALNDLWEYVPSTGLWTWIAGSSTEGASGTYGTQGSAAGSSSPGARQMAVGWRDGSGTFWLFGGLGLDAFGAEGNLNDLWSFAP